MRQTPQPNIGSESAGDKTEALNDFDQMIADFDLTHGKEA
jgi:hypothetical protein